MFLLLLLLLLFILLLFCLAWEVLGKEQLLQEISARFEKLVTYVLPWSFHRLDSKFVLRSQMPN